MMNVSKFIIIVVLFTSSSALISQPVAEQSIPDLQARVTDTAGLLDAGHIAALEKKLSDFEKLKGSQVAVLIVPAVKPESIEQYSIRVVEKWKLGRKKIDDGVLLIVAREDREIRIEVGYGLEGALPDSICSRIIHQVMIPAFKEGDYSGGIDAGVDAILKRIDGETVAPPTWHDENSTPNSGRRNAGILFAVLVVIGLILSYLTGRFLAGLLTGTAGFFIGLYIVGSASTAIVIALGIFFFIIIKGSGSGGSGFSIGGRSGGGFGGFSGGGGGFGGGGASGRW